MALYLYRLDINISNGFLITKYFELVVFLPAYFVVIDKNHNNTICATLNPLSLLDSGQSDFKDVYTGHKYTGWTFDKQPIISGKLPYSLSTP